MYCANCGQLSDETSRFCKRCGVSLRDEATCRNCGNVPEPDAQFCNHCGWSRTGARPGASSASGIRQYPKSKVAAGVLAILLGFLGIHKFYLGYTGPGLLLLIGTFVSGLLLLIFIGIFGIVAISTITLIEGIFYLTKSDEEFHYTYVENRKDWF